MVMGLDRGQTSAFQKCTSMFRHGNPSTTLILGSAGTGKTKTIIAILEWANENKIDAVVACPTASATVNIADNLPTHIAMKTPCMTVDKLIVDIQYKREASIAPPFVMNDFIGGLVVIDEVGMMSSTHYESLVIKGLKNRGNVKYVLCGDCDQLPPPTSLPFYAHPIFLQKIRNGSVYYTALTTNHRNGQCDKLNEILTSFKTGKVTRKCLEILEEIARRPFPDFVWLYIAQRHDRLHSWNEKKAREVSQRAPRSLKFVPSRYPTRTVEVASGVFDVDLGCQTEGTRVLITQNMSDKNGNRIAVNGDTGIVQTILKIPDKDGNANFTKADNAAFTVTLDRTNAPITVYARQIDAKHTEKPGKDESAWILEENPAKRKKKPKVWVVDVTEGYAVTVYSVQGQTIEDTLVVNWENMTPESLFVALSRVRFANQLRFDSFIADPDRIRRLMRKPHVSQHKQRFLKLITMADSFIKDAQSLKSQLALISQSLKKRQRTCLGF